MDIFFDSDGKSYNVTVPVRAKWDDLVTITEGNNTITLPVAKLASILEQGGLLIRSIDDDEDDLGGD